MPTMDITDAKELSLAINNSNMPKRFLASFFKVQTHATREVQIDFVEGSQKLAPFVRDGDKATVANRGGFNTRFVHCYGIELVRRTSALECLKRLPGEAVVASGLSPELRAAELANRDLKDLKGMTYRAIEKIISDGFFGGSYNLLDAAGNVIDTINFGRESALETSKVWSGANYKGIDSDLDAAAVGINQYSGLTATDIVMGSNAAKIALENDAFLKKLDTKNLDGIRATMTVNIEGRGARLIGSIGGMRVWRYDEGYKDATGTFQTIVPANKVLVLSADLQATLHQGVVGDNEIGWFEGEFAADTWHEKNPAADYLRVRSAPLPVIEQINATAVITVS